MFEALSNQMLCARALTASSSSIYLQIMLTWSVFVFHLVADTSFDVIPLR